MDHAAWKSLALGCPARKLMEELAVEYGLTFKAMKVNIELAEAVENIVSNAGDKALEAIFRSKRLQKSKAVLRLSRKSREVQRHRISRVLDPNSRDYSVAPKGSECIVDTMDFKKILSRMVRVRGFVEQGQALIGAHGRDELQADWIIDVETTTRQFESVLKKHVQIVSKLSMSEVEIDKPSSGKPSKKLTLEKLPQLLKAALGLIEKTVRDIPRSSYDLRPSMEQRKAAKSETSRIHKACRSILSALSGKN